MPFRSRSLAALGLLLLPAVLRGQAPPASPEDVGTIQGIVRAYYDVINGPPGAPRQWRRDSTLYMPGATFVAVAMDKGKPRVSIMTPEQYRRAVNDGFVKNGFFETEIGSRIEHFGNVAAVRSVYETRRVAAGPLIGRGINYLQLYWDGTRWWISAASWEDEREDNKLPQKWIGIHEMSR
jgi:hypothetical protein